MRRMDPRRRGAAAIWAVALMLTAAGADKKPPSLKDEVPLKADETVGDRAAAGDGIRRRHGGVDGRRGADDRLYQPGNDWDTIGK